MTQKDTEINRVIDKMFINTTEDHEWFTREDIRASLERLYQMGYEEGVKDELKCIENYPKDHPHLYPIYNGQLIEN